MVVALWRGGSVILVRSIFGHHASPSHSPVGRHIRNSDQVMYNTLKQKPAFRHDSTEGHWVMRQACTLGTRPDVHKSCEATAAADVVTLQSDKCLTNMMSPNKTWKLNGIMWVFGSMNLKDWVLKAIIFFSFKSVFKTLYFVKMIKHN